jgi:hypothetical protein
LPASRFIAANRLASALLEKRDFAIDPVEISQSHQFFSSVIFSYSLPKTFIFRPSRNGRTDAI